MGLKRKRGMLSDDGDEAGDDNSDDSHLNVHRAPLCPRKEVSFAPSYAKHIPIASLTNLARLIIRIMSIAVTKEAAE